MTNSRVLIIGGGLAGLSAGCHALRNGYAVTLVEHNLALGGVCASWPHEPYIIDGCIHWLTGGAYQQLYEELDILPQVGLRVLETWGTYREVKSGLQVAFTRDLDALVRQLAELSPRDTAELARLRRAAREFVAVKPPLRPQELLGVRERLQSLWELAGAAGTFLHYGKPIGDWARAHLESTQLRRLFTRVLPESAPALFLLMVLGYLEQGYLSRPIGGTAAFTDALVRSFRARGGEALLHSTVDEVLVEGNRAKGVRLSDGSQLLGDVVISTSSAPETVLRLLGGRFDAEATRDRLARWKLVGPIVLASFGVQKAYPEAPALLMLDGVTPFEIGGRTVETLYVRVCNDDSCFAPPGHTVVQAMLPTDYDWWATRGTSYGAAKRAVGETVLAQLAPHFEGMRETVRVTDISTPLTYWNSARSWRGAYEGWIPSADAFFGHIGKKLRGLEGFYMAGQWVEPGGGIPVAVLSGRQAVELMCHDHDRQFIV